MIVGLHSFFGGLQIPYCQWAIQGGAQMYYNEGFIVHIIWAVLKMEEPPNHQFY